MKNEKNKDNIYREKLESFSVPPPPHIWNNVQTRLVAQKRKKRMAFVRWISAAAVVLIAFVAGWYFNDNKTTDTISAAKNEIIQPEQNTLNKNESTISLNENDKSTAQKELKVTKEINKTTNIETGTKNVLLTENERNDFNTKETINGERAALDMEFIERKNIFLYDNTGEEDIKLAAKKIESNYLTHAEQFIIADNIQNFNSISKATNSWKMGMFVSPEYSSHVANHAEGYSQDMTYSGSSGNTGVSGGFSVQYKTNKKWIFESGVYYAQNGQKSQNSPQFFALGNNSDYMYQAAPDQSYFSNTVKVSNGNIAMNSTAGVIAFSETPKGAEIRSDIESTAIGASNALLTSGEFSQVFEFVEIPMYVRYRVLDAKFGIELLGGFNAGVLVGNNAYIDNDYGLQNVGKTQDIAPVNLSGTLGMGLNYALGKHFSLALEPRLNYYLSSINNNPAVDYRPYRIGFFTGVSYEF